MCKFDQRKLRTVIPKEESRAESQRRRKRKLMGGNNNPTGGRAKLSIADVPRSIRDVAGSQVNRIQIWPNQHTVATIKQLEDERHVDGNVQILLNMIDGRKLKNCPSSAPRK